jgi:hypothetical protein
LVFEDPQQGRNGAANVFLSHICRKSLKYDIAIWRASKVWGAISASASVAWRLVSLSITVRIPSSPLPSWRSRTITSTLGTLYTPIIPRGVVYPFAGRSPWGGSLIILDIQYQHIFKAGSLFKLSITLPRILVAL